MASNGSCFMVTRTIFKTPSLGGRPNTKNQETMALWMLTTVGLFHFIMREDSCEYKFIEIAFGWGTGYIWLHTTFEGLCAHDMILEMSWGGLQTLSFGLSQLHGHGSWLVCEVALTAIKLWADSCPNRTKIFVRSQLWNCWDMDVGAPFYTLLQPEMPTDGVGTGRCDQPLRANLEVGVQFWRF